MYDVLKWNDDYPDPFYNFWIATYENNPKEIIDYMLLCDTSTVYMKFNHFPGYTYGPMQLAFKVAGHNFRKDWFNFKLRYGHNFAGAFRNTCVEKEVLLRHEWFKEQEVVYAKAIADTATYTTRASKGQVKVGIDFASPDMPNLDDYICPEAYKTYLNQEGYQNYLDLIEKYYGF